MSPDMTLLDDSLNWLAKRGWLSGSFARCDGTGTFKDIDVRLADRYVAQLKRLLTEQKVEWDSPFMGCITWWPEGIQVETAFIFPRYRTGDKSVFGVRFRT